MSASKLSSLEANLQYKFINQDLLDTALRHRSVGKISNERLEFLGDAVLNLIIAAELYNKYPNLREGQLSRLRSNLVRKETLAELAKGFAIGDFLYLGVGEKKTGGSGRASILADALEAIIGAIYLDSNINVCQQVILNWYTDRLTDLVSTSQKDPKTILQEYVQAHKLPLPAYEVVATEGKVHKQIFHIACKVAGLDIAAQGQGLSKQEAEQNAAKEFLEQLT